MNVEVVLQDGMFAGNTRISYAEMDWKIGGKWAGRWEGQLCGTRGTERRRKLVWDQMSLQALGNKTWSNILVRAII